jgi:hypothetical protein
MSDFNKLASAADLWIELGLSKQAGKLEDATVAISNALRNRALMGGVGATLGSSLGYVKYKKRADGQSKLDKEVALANKIDELQQETTGKKPGVSAKLRNLHHQLVSKNPGLIGALEGGLSGGLISAGMSHLLRKKG